MLSFYILAKDPSKGIWDLIYIKPILRLEKNLTEPIIFLGFSLTRLCCEGSEEELNQD